MGCEEALQGLRDDLADRLIVLVRIRAELDLELVGDADAELAHGRPSSLDPGLRSFRGGIPGLELSGGTLGRADKAEGNLSYLEGKDLW
jgi:hypothetical protein